MDIFSVIIKKKDIEIIPIKLNIPNSLSITLNPKIKIGMLINNVKTPDGIPVIY